MFGSYGSVLTKLICVPFSNLFSKNNHYNWKTKLAEFDIIIVNQMKFMSHQHNDQLIFSILRSTGLWPS